MILSSASHSVLMPKQWQDGQVSYPRLCIPIDWLTGRGLVMNRQSPEWAVSMGPGDGAKR